MRVRCAIAVLLFCIVIVGYGEPVCFEGKWQMRHHVLISDLDAIGEEGIAIYDDQGSDLVEFHDDN